MKHSRHSTSTVMRTAAQKVAVILAFNALVVVVGLKPAFATIENTARASGNHNGTPVQSNIVTVQVPVAPAAPSLLVTKVVSPSVNVAAGTTVTYTYTVRNNGNQVLTNVSLNDVHNGSGPAPLPGNEVLSSDAAPANDSSDGAANNGVWTRLAPGDVITLTSTYIITQQDVDTRQ